MNGMTMTRRVLVLSLVVGLGLAGIQAGAQTRAWDNSSTDGKWNTAANWVDNTVPLNGNSVVFDDTSLSPSVMDLTLNMNSAYLNLVMVTNSSGAHSLDLNNKKFTIRGFSIAENRSGGNITIFNGPMVSNNAAAYNLYVGKSGGGIACSGTAVFGISGQTVTFAGLGGSMYVGYGAAGLPASGTLDFRNTVWNMNNTPGMLNFTNITIGYIAASAGAKWLIGTSANQRTLRVVSKLEIGNDGGASDGGPCRVGAGNDGESSVPGGMNLVLGGDGTVKMLQLYVGYQSSAWGSVDGKMVVDPPSAGLSNSLSGVVTNFYVGSSGNLNVTNSVKGVLDLRNVPLVGSGLEVPTELRVGVAKSTNSAANASYGKLYLGYSSNDTAIVTATKITVGYLSQFYNTGLLDTYGTAVKVTGTAANSLLIDATGVVTNHIMGRSAGFTITNATANTFAINTGGKLVLSFEGEPNASYTSGSVYYGLRQTGDHTASWTALNNSGADATPNTADDKLRWITTGLSKGVPAIHYNAAGDFTYVGFALVNQGTIIAIH